MVFGCNKQSTAGDTPAKTFELLTRQHVAALWRTAFRMTGCRDAADELTQEACLKAFRSLNQYQAGTNYKAWIFRILTNLCRDHLRRESRAPFKAWNAEEVNAALASRQQSNSQPEMHCQRTRFYADAIEAMARLTPEVRQVVALSLLDGLTYQQIAHAVDVPIGTVRSRLSRGRKQLQMDLQAHVSDPETTQPAKSGTLPSETMPLLASNTEQKC